MQKPKTCSECPSISKQILIEGEPYRLCDNEEKNRHLYIAERLVTESPTFCQ
jgi:hypothetical protein